MSSQTPPNPWFNAINYNPTFFATSTAGVSLSYVNANFLKSSAGSNPLSYATSTTFLNSVVLGNTTILQTGVNFDIRNNSVSSTMTVRLNNGASVAQTVMSLNGLGNNTSAFYGNSTTSTTASNVAVNDVSIINGSYNLLMASGYSSSTLAVNGTSSLLYNPSTGVLQAPASQFSGSVSLAVPPAYTYSTVPTYTSGMIGYSGQVTNTSYNTAMNLGATWTSVTPAFSFLAVGVYMIHIRTQFILSGTAVQTLTYHNFGIGTTSNVAPATSITNADGFFNAFGSFVVPITGYLTANATRILKVTSISNSYYENVNFQTTGTPNTIVITPDITGYMYWQYTRIA